MARKEEEGAETKSIKEIRESIQSDEGRERTKGKRIKGVRKDERKKMKKRWWEAN